jgi:hypothetical protein
VGGKPFHYKRYFKCKVFCSRVHALTLHFSIEICMSVIGACDETELLLEMQVVLWMDIYVMQLVLQSLKCLFHVKYIM